MDSKISTMTVTCSASVTVLRMLLKTGGLCLNIVAIKVALFFLMSGACECKVSKFGFAVVLETKVFPPIFIF